MPAIKRYTIAQTRQVSVWANDLEGALTIAEGAFAQEHDLRARKLNNANNTSGEVTSPVEETHIVVEKI